MKLTNLTIKDLITPEAKLTFLVGAGCSVDPPSCLPAGRAMMEAIIDYACAESEIDKIKKLEELRFEQLIEILSEHMDPELKIIDFYGLCDTPNLQHFFLAEMMKNGQFVLTTNFDFLIEHALQQSGVPKEEVKVVITKEDFENLDNPQELYSKGLKALYKIHGSTKNVITQDDTRTYLVATIHAFGANKEGENVFQLESYKQPAFINLTKGRSLVVMGYSGSDDFDIVPTLKVLEHIQDIIWINYVHDDGGKENIFEIDVNSSQSSKNLAKVNQILIDIHEMNHVEHIYRVDANTSRIIKDISNIDYNLNPLNFETRPMDWLNKNIKIPNKMMKNLISTKIYLNFNRYNDSMRCLKKILEISEVSADNLSKLVALNYIGLIYSKKGSYIEALKIHNHALMIAEQLKDLSWKAKSLNNIGRIYYDQGNYAEALNRYKKALSISDQLGDLSEKAMCLFNIGMIYFNNSNYLESIIYYEKSLHIFEQLGNLSNKSMLLNNIGEAYIAQENYSKALEKLKESLQIAEQLEDLFEKSFILSSMGDIYQTQGKYSKALTYYEEALHLSEQLGNLGRKATHLNKIGEIYYHQKNYQIALKKFNEAIKIFKQSGKLLAKANTLQNIAMIYNNQENYLEALKRYEEALKILTRIGLGDSPNAKIIKENIEFIKKDIEILKSKSPQN